MKENADALDISAQMRFQDDGLEAEEQVETDLTDWDVHDPGPERETKYEEPRASEFGVDDRETVKQSQSEQDTLLADVDEDQVTLGGESAAAQSKW